MGLDDWRVTYLIPHRAAPDYAQHLEGEAWRALATKLAELLRTHERIVVHTTQSPDRPVYEGTERYIRLHLSEVRVGRPPYTPMWSHGTYPPTPIRHPAGGYA